MKKTTFLSIISIFVFTMSQAVADIKTIHFSSTDTEPCSITINKDLTFTIPNAMVLMLFNFPHDDIFYDARHLAGQIELSVDFQFFGEQNGQLMWKLGDVGMPASSSSCSVSIDPAHSFTLANAVYDGGPLEDKIALQADFKYSGEQNGAFLWYLADIKVGNEPTEPIQSDCGAYVAPGVWKEFDCYNLAAIGKTTNDDPFIPSWRLIGGYWQWGRKGADPSKWYDLNTEHFAHGPTGPDAGKANGAGINGWDQTNALNGAWTDSRKTANDPCPDGFRVPSQNQWDGVRDNNTQSAVGTWSSKATNYSSAQFLGSDLMLPAAGYRNYSGSGALEDRGGSGSYWSSSETPDGSAWLLYFYTSGVDANISDRRNGFSIRCVSE